jgi:hypothetical protein
MGTPDFSHIVFPTRLQICTWFAFFTRCSPRISTLAWLNHRREICVFKVDHVFNS